MLGSRLIRHTSQCVRSLATFSKDRKRFYKDIDVVKSNEGYQISLDGKYNVRTPFRNLLLLPTEKLANAVAVEWDSQVLKQKQIQVSLNCRELLILLL